MAEQNHHDPRIDLLRNKRLRSFAFRLESLANKLHSAVKSDPELWPVLGALFLTTMIWLATQDLTLILITFQRHANLFFPLLFLMGVQYGRLYWRRR